MAQNQNEIWLNHDMMNAVKVQYLDGNFFSQDSSGNIVGVHITKGGSDYDSGGTISASVIRADGATVAVSGTLSGSNATVVLPQSAFAIPGLLSIVIKLTKSDQTTTVGALVANVYQSSTSTAVDPGTIITSIDDLIAEIDAAVDTIPLDYSTLDKRVKYNALQGKYITIEHPYQKDLGVGVSWSFNSIASADGSNSDNGYNLRTDDYIQIDTPKGDGVFFEFKETPTAVALRVFYYDSSKTFISYDSGTTYYTTGTSIWYGMPAATKYIRVVLHDSSWGVLNGNPYDFANTIRIYSKCGDPTPAVPTITYFPGETLRNDNNANRPKENAKRVLTDFIPIGKGTVVRAPSDTTDGANASKIWAYEYDENLYQTGESSEWMREIVYDHDCYVRYVLRKKDASDLTDEDIAEVEQYLSFDYCAPTCGTISETHLNGGTIIDPVTLIGNTDIIHGQLWEYGFIGTDGANSLNAYLIRLRNKVHIAKFSSLVIDCTGFASVYGRYVFYDGTGAVVQSQNLSGITGENTISVPSGATTFRISIATGWTSAVNVTDGAKLKIRGEIATETVKPYYITPIDTAVSAYVQKAESNRLGYLWMSDIHLSTNHLDFTYGIFANALAAARRTAEQANVDFIVIGGDVINAESNSANIYPMLAKAFKPLDGCSIPVIWLLGNHDDNAYGSQVISKSLAISLFPANSKFYNDIHWQTNGYYYFDIPQKNKRIVCLNASDYPSNKNGSNYWSLSQAQVEWICSTAFDTAYDIVVLSHMCPNYDLNFYHLGDEGGYQTDLINAMQAYNSKSSITLFGHTYNFNRDTNNVIKVMHVGHWHWENNPDYLPISSGGVTCIMTGCAKQWSQGLQTGEIVVNADACVYTFNASTAESWQANSYGYDYTHWHDRTAGTIKEALFDLVSVNSTKAHCFRIGAGLDREFTL